GLQGSGKTTTAAKLAWYFKTRKLKSGLIAADTYRAGAYDQLKQLSEKVGALFYGDPRERDPVAISLRGVEELKKQGVDVIIIDTAGRHGYGNEADLLEEMRQIASAVKPDEIVMVLDASIGQKASEIAKRFHEATPIGSIVISKMDGTAKGGGALSAVAMTGAKIKFIGTGEEISEIEPFRTKSFVSRILGLGDIEGLLERMRSLEIDKEELEKQAEEMLTKGLNMKLIYKQLMQIRKMGPLSKVLKMIPGFSMSIPDDSELEKIGEEKFDRWIAAINSMTYEELEKPELIEREKSRLRRIAIGSGTRVEDVRELLKYYEGTRRMLKQLKRKKSVLKKLEKEGEGLF
ncbi:MAG: signal recognition particle protein Srp19, partial [Fervidicoccaceae archaeon]